MMIMIYTFQRKKKSYLERMFSPGLVRLKTLALTQHFVVIVLQRVRLVSGDPTASTHVTVTTEPTAVLMMENASAPEDGLASTAHSVSHRHTHTHTLPVYYRAY